MQSGGTCRRMTESTGRMRRNRKKEKTDMASAYVQKSAVKAGKCNYTSEKQSGLQCTSVSEDNICARLKVLVSKAQRGKTH